MRAEHHTPTRPFRLRPGHIAARARLVVARHPNVQWALIGALAVITGVTVSCEVDAAREAQSAWGTTATAWVATRDIAEGEPIVARRRSVPVGLRPSAAAGDPVGHIARRSIGVGEIITDTDLEGGPLIRAIPSGWLIAPVLESVRSGAMPGDRVRVVGDGTVIAHDAIVAEVHDDVTLVAVPAEHAPALPRYDGVALLLVP